MIATRRLARLIAAGAFAFLPTLTATPAQADDQLQLSIDDQHWHTDLDQPLFDPARRWVPGDATTVSFWIRNTADSSGRLGLTAQVADAPDLLQQGLQLRARAADHDWTALPVDGTMQSLSNHIAAGTTEQVWVTASFAATAGNVTQDRRLDVDFRVTLTQLTGPAATPTTQTAPGGTGHPGPPGSLAGTGLDKDVLGLAIVALATIGAGIAALRAGRKGEHD
jgi:hypothetical protein